MENKTKTSLIKNYIYNIIYEILVLIVPFITATYTSRIFGPDGIGVYSYTNTVSSYAILVSTLGISLYGQREISRKRENMKEVTIAFWELVVLRAFLTAICLIIYFGISIINDEYKIYLITFSILIIANIFDISWFYRGIENFKWITIWQIIIKMLSIIMLFVFIKEKSDLINYILIISTSTLFGNIMSWLALKKYLVKINQKIVPFSHLRRTFVYFVPIVAASIYTQWDKLMIEWITKDNYENGYYEQATKIVGMCKVFVLTINTVVSSRTSYLFEQKKYDEIENKIEWTMNFTLFLSIPMFFGINAVASNFVPIFFGQGYEKVITLLHILSFILIILGISNVLDTCYFTSSGQRAKSNKVILLAAFLNIILNSILIPVFKSIGASISAVFSEFLILIFYIFMSKGVINIFKIISLMWKKIVAALIMFVLILITKYLTETTIISLICEILFGGIVYLLILVLLKDNIILEGKKTIISFLKKKNQIE